MGSIDWLIDGMKAHPEDLALAMPGVSVSYGTLVDRVGEWREALAALPAGRVISIEGDYGPESIALFLAATWTGHISVPLSPDSRAHHESFLEIASVEYRVRLEANPAAPHLEPTGREAAHPHYDTLRAAGHPGLVLFSSGSTGLPKAAVHDLDHLLAKFRVPRQKFRTLVFLLLDHIGGINTLFYTLSNGGAIVLSRDRSAAAVCEAVETGRVELLPTSPTFLNLLLLSGEARRRDLSSLKLITYGTEPMPASTLERACREFPNARFLQTYGSTELGILRSQSRDSNSLWLRIGGEGFECKVVDGRLWVRAASAMLGYLNAPSPFDAEGFYDTGDLVETDGEWIRFLGRKSDVINVGGNKVHPAEVESTLLEMEDVLDVAVHGEPHALTGQVVAAIVRTAKPEPVTEFKLRMRRFCADRLATYKIPARVTVTVDPIHSSRFKRVRGTQSPIQTDGTI
jgi:acyl-CoA synthetase (AMP-forming)/AMP-acid ligase II